MYLYEKKDNVIGVYELKENEKILEEYRKEQMQKIELNDRIYVAKDCVNPFGGTPTLEYYKTADFFDIDFLDKSSLLNKNQSKFMGYSTFKPSGNMRNNEKTLKYYYVGNFYDRPVIKVKYHDGVRYFLLTNPRYDYVKEDQHGKNYVMKNIIHLPESLYVLQLFEQQKYNLIKDFDMCEVASLYGLTMIDEISCDQLKRMDNCGITNNACHQVMRKAENDEVVLKLMKR